MVGFGSPGPHAAVPVIKHIRDAILAFHDWLRIARPAHPMCGRSATHEPMASMPDVLLPSLARHGRLRSALPAHPMCGRSPTHAAVPVIKHMRDAILAFHDWLRIARPGPPWPGVRQRTRQCRV